MRMGVGLLAITVLAIGCSAGEPPRDAACGAFAPPNRVVGRLELLSARLYRVAIPTLGRRPELESDLPATVIVFDGPLRDVEIRGGAPATTSPLKHVCIVLRGGSSHLYPNVEVGPILAGSPVPGRIPP